MMEVQGTAEEARLLYVERRLQELWRKLQALADKLKAAAEQQSPLGGYGGDQADYRGQVIVAVGPSGGTGGATLGVGTVRRQVAIGGVRYNKTDGTAGHYTDEQVFNDTTGTIPVKTYVIYRTVGGVLTVVVGSCAAAASYSLDDVTVGGG